MGENDQVPQASERPAPRLGVLLASESPLGIIFRRGPSRVVRVVIWNRATDKFKPGPRFRGRIYPERSDLSPDGKHLIYFAMGGVAWAIPATKGTWTAISEVPALRALALWGQGDTRGGGGFFLSNDTFWLDAGQNTFFIRDNSRLRRETYGPHRPFKSRAERDGWRWVGKGGIALFEKTIRNGWILRRTGWERGYELEQPGECKLEFKSWEWADWDRQRLVWAEGGCLRAARVGSHRLGTVRTLWDSTAPDSAASE
jgi:hypothetical protein